MFGALYAAEGSSIDALLAVAADFTPRFEIRGPREVTLDLSGLTRLFGHPRAVGDELRRAIDARGLRVCIAIAETYTAARLLAAGHALSQRAYLPPAPRPLPPDVIIVEPGSEAAALAPLPIELLPVVANAESTPSHPRTVAPSHLVDLMTFRRWGIRTLGDLTALPADAVAARLGTEAVRWQRLARGEDPRPLRPALPEERFEQALDLEWPIEGLEPLSFVLSRLLEPLTAHLDRRGRGAAVLHLRLHLVTRAVHERSLQLPAPMRDARTLRTLLLLDLESHPPSAAIDRVVVAADPTPARVLQFSLLTRPLPSPEQLSTLTVRLAALMGEGRCGSPAVVDSWQPGAFAMKGFSPRDSNVIHSNKPRSHGGTEANVSNLDALCVSVSPWPVAVKGASNQPSTALRRFRFPVPARVRVEHNTPARVTTDRVAMRPDKPVLAGRSAEADRLGLSGGRVDMCAGPWRTSGEWWVEGWDRDEWDVTLGDGATYRLFRDRATDGWFLEGIYD